VAIAIFTRGTRSERTKCSLHCNLRDITHRLAVVFGMLDTAQSGNITIEAFMRALLKGYEPELPESIKQFFDKVAHIAAFADVTRRRAHK
jgi:hypothetical protein